LTDIHANDDAKWVMNEGAQTRIILEVSEKSIALNFRSTHEFVINLKQGEAFSRLREDLRTGKGRLVGSHKEALQMVIEEGTLRHFSRRL